MKFTAQKIQLLLPFVYLILFFGVYYAFTNDTIYHKTLSKVIKPYQGYPDRIDGHRADQPYTTITKQRLTNWDGMPYYEIGKYGYYHYYTTAFFPLFPLLFKLTGFSILTLIVNFLLFSLSLRYLFRKIGNAQLKDNSYMLLLLLALPSAFVFFIPYSEALFFFCFTIFIGGWLSGNKYLLFTGLLLAATTRPIVTIVLLSVLSVEFIMLLQTRSLKATLNSMVVLLPPMLTGTFISVFIQYLYTGSFTNFISVQKDIWHHTFSIPTKITDWSDEGHTLNMVAILFIVLPALYYCATVFVKAMNKNKQLFSSEKVAAFSIAEKLNYLTILSAAYVIGSFCFIMFFQDGSLHGMFRYIMCTPFFYILLIVGLNKIQTINSADRKKLLITIGGICALFVLWVGVHNQRLINKLEFAFVLLVAMLVLAICYNLFSARLRSAAAIVLAFLGLMYQTYLFNSFLANSWILT